MKYDQIISTVLASDGINDWITSTRGERTVHFNVADVDLRIEYSLDESFVHEEEFSAPWTKRFASPEASSHYVNLVYRSTLLHEFVLVFVDGDCVGIPLPNPGTHDVEQLHYRIAQIVNRGGHLDEHLAVAGMRVLP